MQYIVCSKCKIKRNAEEAPECPVCDFKNKKAIDRLEFQLIPIRKKKEEKYEIFYQALEKRIALWKAGKKINF